MYSLLSRVGGIAVSRGIILRRKVHKRLTDRIAQRPHLMQEGVTGEVCLQKRKETRTTNVLSTVEGSQRNESYSDDRPGGRSRTRFA